MTDTPALSVVLVTPTGFSQIHETVGYLLAQTVLDRIELVIVAPSQGAVAGGAAVLDQFPWHRVVPVERIVRRGTAAAEGVRVARAPVVAFIEEHAFPAPGWAEAFLRAHEDRWTVVSPAMRNANPGSIVSWAHWYRSYLGLTAPLCAGEVDNVSWHNSAYKRDALLSVGDRLGALLDYEGDLLAELRARGHRFYLEPEAQTDHLNVETMGASLDMFFQKGRLAGAQRAAREEWPTWRRLIYVAGSPLTPLMHVPSLRADVRRTRQPARRVLQAIPLISVSLVAMALGEVVGLVAGLGRSKERMEHYELHRRRYVSARTLAARSGPSFLTRGVTR